MGAYTYCVITDPGDADTGCYDDFAIPANGLKSIRGEKIYTTQFGPQALEDENVLHAMIQLRLPVFAFAELLVLGESGREVTGGGRKPAKWFIGYEEYERFEDALDRAMTLHELQITGGPIPPPKVKPVNSQYAPSTPTETLPAAASPSPVPATSESPA